MFLTARINLYILAATYVASAAVLYIGRRQGRPVTWAIIVAWAFAGIAGGFLTAALAEDKVFPWIALLLLLTPLMVRALAGDIQRRHWAVAAFDVTGLGAIAFSLGATAPLIFG